jgi:hypothetical protein
LEKCTNSKKNGVKFELNCPLTEVEIVIQTSEVIIVNSTRNPNKKIKGKESLIFVKCHFLQVILVGGSGKVRRVQKLVRDMFPLETDVLFSIAPDQVLALGAAQQSGIRLAHPHHELPPGETLKAVELNCLSNAICYKVRQFLTIDF